MSTRQPTRWLSFYIAGDPAFGPGTDRPLPRRGGARHPGRTPKPLPLRARLRLRLHTLRSTITG